MSIWDKEQLDKRPGKSNAYWHFFSKKEVKKGILETKYTQKGYTWFPNTDTHTYTKLF